MQWPRFTLRSLLIGIGVLAILMGTAFSLLRARNGSVRNGSVLMEGVDTVTESERMEKERASDPSPLIEPRQSAPGR